MPSRLATLRPPFIVLSPAVVAVGTAVAWREHGTIDLSALALVVLAASVVVGVLPRTALLGLIVALPALTAARIVRVLPDNRAAWLRAMPLNVIASVASRR